jgi:FAS-associated factor 2
MHFLPSENNAVVPRHGGSLGGMVFGGVGSLIRWTWWLATSPLRFLVSLIPNYRATLQPDNLAQLLEIHSAAAPRFVQGTHRNAVDQARLAHRLLFVYLHSPQNQNTNEFIERVLCDARIKHFIESQCVAWSANINTTEGRNIASLFDAGAYPFIALQMYNYGAGGQILLFKSEGEMDPNRIIELMQRVMNEATAPLLAARMETEERDRDRMLRREQQEAYELAVREQLERDRQRTEQEQEQERERRRIEAEREAQLEREREIQRQIELEKEQKEQLARSLPAEPEAGPNTCTIQLRLSDGTRTSRRFVKNDSIATLYAFVRSLASTPPNFELFSNFPKKVYANHNASFEEEGLSPQGLVFVREL